MKKLIIISLVVLVIGLLGGFLLLRNDVSDVSENNGSSNNPSFVLPTEPEVVLDSSRQEATIAVIVEYDRFLNRSAGTSDWKTFAYDGQTVPLSVGVEALELSIPRDIQENMREGNWGIASCATTKDNPGFIFRMSTKTLPNYDGDIYNDTIQSLLAWESEMLQSLQPVLFPSDYYSQGLQNSTFETADTFEYIRTASISDSGVQIGEISYSLIADYILLSSNTECLLEELQFVLEYVP